MCGFNVFSEEFNAQLTVKKGNLFIFYYFFNHFLQEVSAHPIELLVHITGVSYLVFPKNTTPLGQQWHQLSLPTPDSWVSAHCSDAASCGFPLHAQPARPGRATLHEKYRCHFFQPTLYRLSQLSKKLALKTDQQPSKLC